MKKLIRSLIVGSALAGGYRRAFRLARKILRNEGYVGLAIALRKLSGSGTDISSIRENSKSVGDFVDSIQVQLEAIKKIDPRVGLYPLSLRVHEPTYTPNYSSVGEAVQSVFQLIPDYKPDLVIWMSDLNLGGATTLTLQLANSFTSFNSNSKVLVISTNNDDSKMRVENIDSNVMHLALSQSLKGQLLEDQFKIVFELNSHWQSKYQLVVNSDLLFKYFEIYSQLTKIHSKIGAMFFCQEYDDAENDRGYSNTYFPSLYSKLDFVLFDNRSHFKYLVSKFSLSEVRTRVGYFFAVPEIVQIQREKNLVTPKIVWAGRDSRQKGFDTLIEIARALPDIKFEVFGPTKQAVGHKNIPVNVRILGSFRSFRQILEVNPSIFLNTSKWDGRQIILLNALANRIPSVSSRAGGVAELLDLAQNMTIGIEDANDVDSYVSALRQLIASPSRISEMEKSDLTKILAEHSLENQAKLISDLFATRNN